MKRPNPIAEQMRARENAQQCFARASAILTLPDTKDDGEALFWAALGTVRLAESDPGKRAADRAGEIIQAFSLPKPDAVSGKDGS